MEDFLVWKILGIEETSDEDEVKKAYRAKLATVNPEDDQEGFMQLREAYEQALDIIARRQQKTLISEDEEILALKNGDEYDKFMYEIHMLYRDFNRRIDPEEWNDVFSLDICETAEVDGTIPERLLAFFMEHYYLPTDVWRCIDSKFHYVEKLDDWRELFPENYLNFIRYKIIQGEFLDFDCLSGDLSSNVDDFLRKYLSLKDCIDLPEEQGLDSFEALYNELELYDIEYPHTKVEYMRYLYERDKENGNPPCEEALEMANSLYDTYGDVSYIEYYCGFIFEQANDLEKAEAIFKKILETQPMHYGANVGMASVLEKRGEYRDAKEIVLDLLENDESNTKLHTMCDEINKKYIEYLREKFDNCEEKGEIAMEMAWSYFQLHDFDKTMESLSLLPEEKYDDYDYVNLKGRNLLAKNNYEEALPYLIKWHEYLLDAVDDGTKENRRKVKRVAFSYFAIGLCQWHVADRDEAIINLNKGVDLEEGFYIKLSYMEEIARLYSENKEWDKAIEICNKIIEQDKGYYPAYLVRQKCYFELKVGQGVIDDFFACTNIFPGYVKPYVYAMKVFFFYEEYDNVAHVYEQAKENNLESDEMELYYIKMLCMTKNEPEQLRGHLDKLNELKASYYKKKGRNEESDLDEDELISEVAIIHWDLRDYEKAIQECESGLKKNPNFTRLLKLLGDIYSDQKQNDKAIEQYNKYIEIKDDNDYVYLSLGKCYWRKNMFEDALINMKKSYELYPNSDEVMWYLARINSELFKKKHDIKYYDEAIHFASIRIENSESAYNLNERGIIRESAHDLAGALEDYLKAAELEPDNVYVINNIADIYRMMRKDELAISYMEKALKLNFKEENVWVYSNMAKYYEHRGEHEKAWQYSLKQLELNSGSIFLYKQLARQYKNAKKFEDAIAIYKKLGKSGDISKVKMLTEIGDCYFDKDDFDEALKYYNKALTVAKENTKKSNNEKYWEELMNVYECFGTNYLFMDSRAYADKVIEYYEKCYEIATEHVPGEVDRISEALVENCYEFKEYDKAKKYAKVYLDVLERDYGSVDGYLNDRRYLRVRAVNICFCYVALGEMELAEKYLKLSLEGYLCCHCEYKDCFEAYLIEGIICEIKGDKEGAKKCYEKSVEINPDAGRSNRLLKRINEK